MIKDYADEKNNHKIQEDRMGWCPKPASVAIRKRVLCTEVCKDHCLFLKQLKSPWEKNINQNTKLIL